jgi:hypothetical protein
VEAAREELAAVSFASEAARAARWAEYGAAERRAAAALEGR